MVTTWGSLGLAMLLLLTSCKQGGAASVGSDSNHGEDESSGGGAGDPQLGGGPSGGLGKSSSKGGIRSQYVSAYLRPAELPACDRDFVGAVVYLIETAEFKYCDSGFKWTGLDLAPGKTTYGPSSLFKADIEGAGQHCPAGGSRITSGIDRNGNQVLDPNEVDQTSYACHGMMGATGSQGAAGVNGSNAAEFRVYDASNNEVGLLLAEKAPFSNLGGSMYVYNTEQQVAFALDALGSVDGPQVRDIYWSDSDCAGTKLYQLSDTLSLNSLFYSENTRYQTTSVVPQFVRSKSGATGCSNLLGFAPEGSDIRGTSSAHRNGVTYMVHRNSASNVLGLSYCRANCHAESSWQYLALPDSWEATDDPIIGQAGAGLVITWQGAVSNVLNMAVCQSSGCSSGVDWRRVDLSTSLTNLVPTSITTANGLAAVSFTGTANVNISGATYNIVYANIAECASACDQAQSWLTYLNVAIDQQKIASIAYFEGKYWVTSYYYGAPNHQNNVNYCASGCNSASNWNVLTVQSTNYYNQGHYIHYGSRVYSDGNYLYYSYMQGGSSKVNVCRQNCQNLASWQTITLGNHMNQSSWIGGDFESWDNATWVLMPDDMTNDKKLTLAKCTADCTSSTSWTVTTIPVPANVDVTRLGLSATRSGLVISAMSEGRPYLITCGSGCTESGSWVGYVGKATYPAVVSSLPGGYVGPVRVGVR